MINQLLKIGILYQAWRWFKPRSNLLLTTFSIVIVSWVLQAEYADYLDKSDHDGHLGFSYLLKWVITFAAVLVIYIIEKLRVIGSSKLFKPRPNPTTNLISEGGNTKHSDPFERIREKEKLEGRADKLLK